MGIGEVALHCGYGDQPAFSKAFKRSFGLTPSECRLGAPLAEPAR
jgi:AraC-like DNA-binding protein